MPQLNIGGQFGVTALAGTTRCASSQWLRHWHRSTIASCRGTSAAARINGFRLPFGGIYGDALNHMLDARSTTMPA